MGIYTLVNIQKAIENGPVEIVDFPIKHGDFPVRYVTVYQAGYGKKGMEFFSVLGGSISKITW